jgi:phosphatidylglycerophosphate synthase
MIFKEGWTKESMESFKKYRDLKLRSLGLSLRKLRISANFMTTLAFLFGLLAVYFLFRSYWLFFLFVFFHLLADALDGVLARLSQETSFGHYYDHLTDRLVTLFILLKIGWYLQDYYVYVTISLFILAQLVYTLSKFTSPILFTRTLTLLLLLFLHPSLANYSILVLTLTYLTTGVASAFSLAKQLQWYFERRMKF